jgi:hypothetical protein
MSFKQIPGRVVANGTADALDVPIWGVRAIAAASNLTLRQAYHALERGYLPASKAGRKWFTTPRRLRTLFAGEEAAKARGRIEAAESRQSVSAG